MTRTSTYGLRRRLFSLVYRDAARLHGMGVAVVVLPLVYLWREWPPWAIRSAIEALPAATQAGVVLVAIAGYARLTAAPVRTLLASQRLQLWRTLPLSRGFWRRTHGLHLLLLDAPWLGVIAYAVALRPTTPAVLAWISAVGLTIALQVSAIAYVDRPRARIGVHALAIGLSLATWLSRSAELAGAVGLVMATLSYLRLADPFAEPPAAARRILGRLAGPARAWARLLFVAWLRRAPLFFAGTILGQILGVAAVVLADRHVGAIDPDGVLALARFVAVLGGWVGASALLQSVRAIDRDRAWLDALPLTRRAEHRARLHVAILGGAPTWVLLAVLSPAPLEALAAAAWAAAAMADLVAGRERARTLHDRLVERIVLAVAVALAAALATGHTAALLPWAAWSAARAYRRLDEAADVRARFETPREGDDHG